MQRLLAIEEREEYSVADGSPSMPLGSGSIWELVRNANSRGPLQISIRSSGGEAQQPVL